MLDVTPATPDEIGIVAGLLEDAAAWVREQGVLDQWPLTFNPEWLAAGIRRKQTWLARDEDQVVGTITLNWSDPLWTDLGPTDVAGYVHRLTARRGARGLCAALLDWAAGEIQARGRDLLRLDCVTWNTRLNQYYLDAGFAPMGPVSIPEAPELTLSRYQRYVDGRT